MASKYTFHGPVYSGQPVPQNDRYTFYGPVYSGGQMSPQHLPVYAPPQESIFQANGRTFRTSSHYGHIGDVITPQGRHSQVEEAPPQKPWWQFW